MRSATRSLKSVAHSKALSALILGAEGLSPAAAQVDVGRRREFSAATRVDAAQHLQRRRDRVVAVGRQRQLDQLGQYRPSLLGPLHQPGARQSGATDLSLRERGVSLARSFSRRTWRVSLCHR